MWSSKSIPLQKDGAYNLENCEKPSSWWFRRWRSMCQSSPWRPFFAHISFNPPLLSAWCLHKINILFVLLNCYCSLFNWTSVNLNWWWNTIDVLKAPILFDKRPRVSPGLSWLWFVVQDYVSSSISLRYQEIMHFSKRIQWGKFTPKKQVGIPAKACGVF